ncbi:MAG TPA: hypothetical protein PLU35_12810 [Phycisphaerales bacterium]|nr:hypothetical protein [Phycisphaerales bacterium]
MRICHLFAVACSIACFALIASAQRAATFFGLGDLPGGGENSVATAMTGDGRAVVGFSLAGGGFPGLYEGFRWTHEDGMIGIGTLPGGNETQAYGISADGRHVAGNGNSSQGLQAFLWTEGVGIQGLGKPDGATSTSARSVSMGGSAVVGRVHYPGRTEAFRWTPESGMVGLGTLPGMTSSIAVGVSSDGAAIGGSSSGQTDGRGFLWTAQDGMIGLGVLYEPAPLSSAHAVSPNGEYVVGRSNAGLREEAFVWSEEWGMRSVRSVLLDAGIDITALNWSIGRASGVTVVGDTLIITGTGWNHTPNRQEAWIAHIPIPAPGSLAPLALTAAAMRRRR